MFCGCKPFFLTDFQLQYSVERHVEWLESRMSETGETLQGVSTLIEQLDKFEDESKVRGSTFSNIMKKKRKKKKEKRSV